MVSKTTTQNTEVSTTAPERVADILNDRIKSGVYQSGDLLPAERSLAADLGVHRRSVRIAIDQLVHAGLITRRANCRPTVGSTNSPERDQTAHTTAHSTSAGISSSKFIALIMWHGGGPLEHAGSSQQRIFWGMNQKLLELGYHAVFLNLGDLGSDDQNAENEAKHLNYIREQGFGGAVFYPYAYNLNHELVREVNRSVPIVLLDRNLMGSDMDFVGVQNLYAMKQVTQHLIAQGHRRIALVTRNERIHPVVHRAQGYSDAMWEEPSDSKTEMILTIPYYEDDRDWNVVDAVFRLPCDQRPTAAVCLNDYVAVLLATRLEYLGLKVPDDVAVTGFDNIIPLLPNGIGLTSLAQPFEKMGEKAVELLVHRINNPTLPPQCVELPAQLIVRQSSTQTATS